MHNNASFKNRLRKLITGLNVPQEYCCLEFAGLSQGLSVYMTVNHNDNCVDVTDQQLLLGYKPLIIGLPPQADDSGIGNGQRQICLNLVQGPFKDNMKWRSFPADKSSIARIILSRIGERTVKGQQLNFYKGEYAAHSFLNPFYQFVNRRKEDLRRRPSDNIGLPGNLYDQVRVGYAVPRRISVITTSDGELMNMFPTDLHGPFGDTGYAGSLRIGGEANNQVEKYKRVVLSEVDVASYKQTYGLGKNHMRQLQLPNRFPISSERSKSFGFPLPSQVTNYYELNAVDSIDFGVHRIHLYEIVNRHQVKQGVGSLAHIHQYYAQWRVDHGLDTPILIR